MTQRRAALRVAAFLAPTLMAMAAGAALPLGSLALDQVVADLCSLQQTRTLLPALAADASSAADAASGLAVQVADEFVRSSGELLAKVDRMEGHKLGQRLGQLQRDAVEVQRSLDSQPN